MPAVLRDGKVAGGGGGEGCFLAHQGDWGDSLESQGGAWVWAGLSLIGGSPGWEPSSLGQSHHPGAARLRQGREERGQRGGAPFLFLTDYNVTGVLVFLLYTLHPAAPTPSGHPPTLVRVRGSRVQVLWLLHLLCHTLHPCGYSVTTYLYFLIPHLFPIPPTFHLATFP